MKKVYVKPMLNESMNGTLEGVYACNDGENGSNKGNCNPCKPCDPCKTSNPCDWNSGCGSYSYNYGSLWDIIRGFIGCH